MGGPPKPLPEYRIIQPARVIHLGDLHSKEHTAWPWPFPDTDGDPDAPRVHVVSAAHRARYSPHLLTKANAMELAGIADAYSTLITHPARGVRETLHTLHRIWRKEFR